MDQWLPLIIGGFSAPFDQRAEVILRHCVRHADNVASAIVGELAVPRYGVNGDPLKEGKLDLAELLEQPTPNEWEWARDFIAQRSWREAVTYRETAPHQYVVRKWEIEAQGNRDFDRFITLIRRFGHAEFFYKVRHLYWAIDEFKYWTMGWPVEETTVINRARVDAPEPWKAS